MTPAILIREATPKDAVALASLLTELGYPTSENEIPARVARHAANGGVLLVAEASGEVAGLATMHIHSGLNRPQDVAWLTLLVVAEAHQGEGIGKALVAAVEKLAIEKGCGRLSVTTAEERVGAQAFYPSVGLPLTGRRYGKML